MRVAHLICVCILAGLLSCASGDSERPSDPQSGDLVHSIDEYGVESQREAIAVTEAMMSHYPTESWVRWRPVRVEPGDVLQDDFLKQGAMPQSLRLFPFPDVNVYARMTRYTVLVGNSAIWEGTTLESNYPNVRITIIGSEAGVPAFIIRILNAPKNYMIFPTDSENIYVALETRPYIE